jgi:FlaA1/EpsC-like NDP-sugar epimerase
MIVLLTDAVLCVTASWLAFSIRFSEWMPWSTPVIAFTLAALLLFPPIFFFTGTYRHIFRFVGAGTISQLASATAVLSVPLLAVFMLQQVEGVPRTLPILFPILFFLMTGTVRIVARHLLVEVAGAGPKRYESTRCIIYGAGTAGQQLAASLRHDSRRVLVAFADDDPNLQGQSIDGVRVYPADQLKRVIAERQIGAIFLAMPEATRSRRQAIIRELSETDVKVQTLPSVAEVLEGRVSISDLREIRIEDLLGRDPVDPDSALLERTIGGGKTVLVTGAGGSIGSELSRQIVAAAPARLVLAEMSEHNLYQIERELSETARLGSSEIIPELVNVADQPQARRLLERWTPDTVFHAAAYKHVPLVETNVVSGLRNNIDGTLNMAVAAAAVEVSHFVLVSTDKAVRPTNVMGASKRVCELILQALAGRQTATRFAMVRFGNVLGSSGSVVPQFEKQIRAGGPLTLTHRDITRYFMTIPEAAQLVIQAGSMAEGGDVFLLDMGEPIRIFDMAKEMIRLAGRTLRDEAHPEGDIEIQEIGIRPGEKLYEELLIDSSSEPTRHPRIMRAREASLPQDVLFPQLDALHECFESGDSQGALAILRRIVPEYQAEGDLSPFQAAAE